MTVIKATTKLFLKIIGYMLVILGQGLAFLTAMSGCLLNALTFILFLMAITASFADMTLGEKILIWVIAVLFGAISINIHTIPELLINTGRHLINK